MNKKELEEARDKARALAPPGNPLSSAIKLLSQNPNTRSFFVFIFLALFSITLMDNILEVFGAEVFAMSIAETTTFERFWGGGILIGMFNVGALALMMEMTVANATGLYMGLWGTAQAFGMGSSSFASGALHTIFIESGVFAPKYAYFGIFMLEAVGLIVAGYILYRISISQFAVTAGQGVRSDSPSETPISTGTASRA
jgi:BCD family chlorophyll transporter-like MFS transporter